MGPFRSPWSDFTCKCIHVVSVPRAYSWTQMLKSSQGIKHFASSNDSVLENMELKIALSAGEEETNRAKQEN